MIFNTTGTSQLCRYQKNHLATFNLFAKMKLQSHVVHINATTLIWLTSVGSSVVSSRESQDIVSSDEILDNIRTAFEKFGAKRNPQLDNKGLLEPGEGSPSPSNGHGLQLAPLYLGKTVRHLHTGSFAQNSFQTDLINSCSTSKKIQF